MVELHIEQGGLLEHEKKQIGVVTSIVGITFGQVTIKGVQNHAGTTPMRLRIDPMPTAAEFILRLHQWAQTHIDDMVCTVGSMLVKPGNSNVIPAQITFTYDIRSTKKELLEEAKNVLQALKKELESKTEICITSPCDDMPVELNSEGIEMLKSIADEKGLDYMEIPSGAGHDSQIFAQYYDTNMIFVPSRDGISHDVKEYTKPEDIEAGYFVLKEYLKRLAW